MNDNQADNVHTMQVVTRHDISPERVLTSAIGKLDGVVVIGYDKEGGEYFASSYADGSTPLWLLERLKIALLNTES